MKANEFSELIKKASGVRRCSVGELRAIIDAGFYRHYEITTRPTRLWEKALALVGKYKPETCIVVAGHYVVWDRTTERVISNSQLVEAREVRRG